MYLIRLSCILFGLCYGIYVYVFEKFVLLIYFIVSAFYVYCIYFADLFYLFHVCCILVILFNVFSDLICFIHFI